MNRHQRRKEKSKTHKEQHFVAKGYLRAWCDPSKADHEKPFVWVMPRDGPTQETPARRRAPANIFWEKEIYTITPADNPQGRDLSLEHALARIESDFCAIRRDFIEPRCSLGKREREVLLAFVASSQYRTPRWREHTRTQWQSVLDLGRRMEERMKGSNAEHGGYSGLSRLASTDGQGMSLDQVQAIVDHPLQTTLASFTRVTVGLLKAMTKLSILCTNRTPGFITSDEPVTWFDPAAFQRPKMFQSPGLIYDTVEITMPISPSRMLFLGRANDDLPEYLDIDFLGGGEVALDELNRRTCRHAREKIVVARNEFRTVWADSGLEPSGAPASPKGAGTRPQ